MFGWKKDRDYHERLDMEVTPWELGKQDLSQHPLGKQDLSQRHLEPRVDVPPTGLRQTLPSGIVPGIEMISGERMFASYGASLARKPCWPQA